MKFNIGNASIDFNVDGVKSRYKNREDFFSDTISAHKGIEEKELRKAHERVWEQSHPKETKTTEASS